MLNELLDRRHEQDRHDLLLEATLSRHQQELAELQHSVIP